MGKAWRFGENMNTDEIIPGRYNITIDPLELAKNVFCEVKPEYAMNVKPDDIIVGGQNFGCGSSREHAPWALEDYGFRVIIAPSYADIFFNNCFKNGLLPIKLDAETVDVLFKAVEASAGYKLKVDLERQTITAPDGAVYKFEVDSFRKHCLLNGLDDIGLTLQHVDDIKAFETKHRAAQPWLFA